MLGDTSVNYSISHHLLASPFLLNVSHSWVNVSGKRFYTGYNVDNINGKGDGDTMDSIVLPSYFDIGMF